MRNWDCTCESGYHGEVYHCPMHSAAGAMYKALKAFDHYLCAAPPLNMKLKKYAVDLMEEALSEAEGKEV